ncbi:MAG: hypothetical protein ACYCUX_08585 [Metallibacterium sp.]
MNHHDDTSAALALRRALRALADDVAPPAALWDRIAAQLPHASVVMSTPARNAWRTPWPALAAVLLLGVGLGLLLPQMLPARALAARDVAGQRALQTALLQLDQAQASLGAAQRLQPQASFITEMRVQTALQRAAIEHRLQGS